MIYDPTADYFDPKPKQDSGSRKSLEVVRLATPSRNEDGFIVDAKERAKHWSALWTNFWSDKWGWQ